MTAPLAAQDGGALRLGVATTGLAIGIYSSADVLHGVQIDLLNLPSSPLHPRDTIFPPSPCLEGSMRGSIAAIVTGLGVLAACQGPQPPVPVLGEIEVLAGRWEGEYGSRESGRAGSILFTLQAGTDTAHGDVLMVPRAWDLPPQPRAGDPDAMDVRRDRPPQALPIAFVRAVGDVVEGRLEPYRDPDCGCVLTTVFMGKLVNPATFEGTFTSIHGSGDRTVRGWWRVTRRAGG